MTIVERGHGDPLVLLTALQGRWEYTRAAVDALAVSHRVVTFPLGDEPSARAPFDPSRRFDSYVDHVEAVLDRLGLAQAIICGVSFGGLMALRFAATRPERTAALVMVSAPGPSWHLKKRHESYARLPWVFGPVFAVESPFRLWKEIAIALPSPAARMAFALGQIKTLIQAPVSLSRMADRARAIGTYDRLADCTMVTAPTLIVHGEPELDHVVDAAGTAEYARFIRGASVAVLERSGHLGSITRPHEFAALLRHFLLSLKLDHHSAA